MTRAVLQIVAFGLCLSFLHPSAAAQPASAVVRQAAEDIRQERYGEAIRSTEAAADEGIVHPDLSFNRGLSYLRRAETSNAEAGDLGQAAAGFAEAMGLRKKDAEAKRGLEQTQLLIAKDRTRSDTSPESSSLGLLERVLLFVSALALVVLGCLGSLLCCVGLGLRAASSETKKVTGGILALVGALLLLPSFALFSARQALFDDAQIAVVIADTAEVVSEAGGRISGRLAYRQGTIVYLKKSSRGFAPLVSFSDPGHIPLARVRILRGGHL